MLVSSRLTQVIVLCALCDWVMRCLPLTYLHLDACA